MQGKSEQASFEKAQAVAQPIDQSSVQACARSLAADSALDLPAMDSLTHFSRSVARGQYDSLALRKAHHDDSIQRRFLPTELPRTEERRGGKKGRSRWSPDH